MIRMTLAALAALLPAAALAQDGLSVRDAYARSANPRTGAVFMVVENRGPAACTLTAVSTEAAERAELHTHAEEGGVMKMMRVEGGIPVPAGGEHALARGGDHVMLMGLKAPLAQGDTVTLTLDFGDCGTRQIEAAVDNDRAPDEMQGHTGH